jgi:hypothetical protein
MDEKNLAHELALIKAQAQVELNKLDAANSAKEVAGKATTCGVANIEDLLPVLAWPKV